MARSFLSSVGCTLLGGKGVGQGPTFVFHVTAHADARREAFLREGAFADSGYWDFALLSLYDKGVRTMVLGGLTALSEFGWTERALVGASQVSRFVPAKGALGPLRSVGGVLANLGLNVALALGGLGGLLAASRGAFVPGEVLEGLTFLEGLIRGAVAQARGLWHDRGFILYEVDRTTQRMSAGWPPFNPHSHAPRGDSGLCDDDAVRALIRALRR